MSSMQDLGTSFTHLDDDHDLQQGPATARITGRLARIDPGKDATKAVLWVIAEDDGYLDADGQPRAGLYQALKVFARMLDLGQLGFSSCMTPMVELACHFHCGQLWLSEILDVQDTDEELPAARVPSRDRPHATDGKLIAPSELERMAGKAEFIAQAHSVYLIPIAWHLTMCPKYRSHAFEGKAVEVQKILRQVAESEGMTVVALAAEPDHVHVLLRGMTPQTNWSAWIGRWEALTSRRLKMLPGLEDFAWQTGYSLSSVAGGKQSVEEELRAVEAYIRSQSNQTDEPEVDVEGGP